MLGFCVTWIILREHQGTHYCPDLITGKEPRTTKELRLHYVGLILFEQLR
jgi:hypothetical protein